jgi:hypothetical protein
MKTNINDWNCDDVILWFKQELKEVSIDYELLKSHELIGRDIIDLTEDNLKYDLKIYKLHDRKLVMRKIVELIKYILSDFGEANNLNTLNNHSGNKIKLEKDLLNSNLFMTQGQVTPINNKVNLPNYNSNITNYPLQRQIKLEYKNRLIKFKCTNITKFCDILKEFIEVLDLKEQENFLILDKEGMIIPKECAVKDISQENEQFFVIKRKNLNGKEKSNIDSGSKKHISPPKSNNLSQVNQKFIKNSKSIKNLNLLENNSQSFIQQSQYHTQNSNNTNLHSNTFSNNFNLPLSVTQKVSTHRNYSLYHNKDFSIQETANKNRYLSFETLDNFEKNGYTFNVRKNMNNSVDNPSEKEKVTINSYYNISNLNNFNNENSNTLNTHNTYKSPFSSFENKSSNLLSGNDLNNYVQKSNKKKKLSCLNIRAKKKIDFDEFSNNDVYEQENENENNFNSDNFIKIDDKAHKDDSDKVDVDSYMNRFMSHKNSVSSIHNQTCNSDQSKKLYDKKLRNYYMEGAKKIKSKLFFKMLI